MISVGFNKAGTMNYDYSGSFYIEAYPPEFKEFNFRSLVGVHDTINILYL